MKSSMKDQNNIVQSIKIRKNIKIQTPTNQGKDFSQINQYDDRQVNNSNVQVQDEYQNQGEQVNFDQTQARSPDRTIYPQKIHTAIKEILEQNNQQFQHSEATCVCSSCLCGRCRCKIPPVKKIHPIDMKSIYQSDYYKQTSSSSRRSPNPYFYSPYKGDNKMIYKVSMYRDNYQAYKQQNLNMNEKSLQTSRYDNYIRDGSPLSDSTQYKDDYIKHKYAKNDMIKPSHQLITASQLDIPQNNYTVYRTEFKKHYQPQIHYNENDKYKLHTQGDEKSLYMNTTYQSEFPKRQLQEQIRHGVQISSMFVGSGKKSNNYKTVYKQDYINKDIRTCPARIQLEQIADKSLSINKYT